MSDKSRRIVGLNLTAGQVNAVEFCTRIYGLPELSTLLDEFEGENVVGLS